ncbi:ParB/RepB/Spo0J family partition protein [soil metagenome]
MNTKKRGGLGRGLEALLGHTATTLSETSAAGELRHLSVEFIQPGKYQPRQDIGAAGLEELTDSIKSQGIIQPIVVRSIANGRYEIVAGERRWRAAQLAGLSEVPVLIREIPDNAAIAIALIENIQREDLNPLEEAIALQRLLDEFSMTHQQVAEAIGKSRASVSNLLRLLSLNEDVKQLLQQGQLEMGHSRALLGLPSESQTKAAETIVAKGLSVRETEELVRRLQNPTMAFANSNTTVDTDPVIEDLQTQLTAKLGKQAIIQHKINGKGKVVLQYRSLLELRAILSNVLS